MQYGYNDYYGEIGCCLTCTEQEHNEIEDGKCLCYECKCRQCYWYEQDNLEADRDSGHCEYPRETTKYNTEYDETVFISRRIKETKKAIYCSISGLSNFTSAYFWIPKSQIKGDKLQNWWLEEQGLEGIVDPHHAQCERCGKMRSLTKIKSEEILLMVCEECAINIKEKRDKKEDDMFSTGIKKGGNADMQMTAIDPRAFDEEFQNKQSKEAKKNMEKIISETPRKNVSVLEMMHTIEAKLGLDIPIWEIITKAEEEGITQEKVEEVLELLKRDGIIFSPTQGIVKFVR